jgi:Na+-driven multidrug efflux pump
MRRLICSISEGSIMDKKMIDNKAFYKNLIRIALPIALQSLMLALVAACDALMLGLGVNAQRGALGKCHSGHAE